MVSIERYESDVITMDVHKSLLEILCAFDSFCSRHNIEYSLHGGTMLGAIREHGFIPWDDDADVTMTRGNFIKLMAALDQADAEYCVKGKIKKQFYRANDAQVWVDIFVCDYISENSVQQKIKLFLLTVLDIMYRDRDSMKLSNLQKYSKGKQLLYKIVYMVGQLFPKKWIAYCYCCVSEKWLLSDKTYMFRSNDQYIGRKLIFPAAWMKEYKYVQFENTMLPVCNETHGLLIQSYGENYMTPVQDNRNILIHNLVRSEQKIEL